MSNQPKWKAIAQLGDVNPIDYGGFWVLRDTTGVYCEEAELLVTPEDEDEDGTYTVYRLILERCTLTDGILSDNKHHPLKNAWFAKPEEQRKQRPQDSTYLSCVAASCGIDVDELTSQLCSSDAIERAQAYRCIGEYHGFENFDSYPLTLSRSECRKRYRLAKYRVDAQNTGGSK